VTENSELIRLLSDAHRAGTTTVDATPYAELSRPDAYAVQTGVLAALGTSVGMLKTGRHSDGVGVVAPILARGVGRSPGFRLPVATVVGLEVEVGVVLARDVASSADIPSAIDHYFLGVEICASRYADRSISGLNGTLADSMSAYGYCIGPKRAAKDAIDGLIVRLEVGGKEIYHAPAKHGFGTVLSSLSAYADEQHPTYPLRAGTIVTTGSMCGMVPIPGAGRVVAALGDESLSFELV
jgi:2-keto-4-pentenoate hydratase